jgi:hypothetical protein
VVTIASISTRNREGADLEGDNAEVKGVGAFIERYGPDIQGSHDTTNGEGTGIERDGAEIMKAL